MPTRWTADQVFGLIRSFQPACVLAAGADLEVFELLAKRPMTASQAAAKLEADERGVTILLDALAALDLLTKTKGRYQTPAGLVEILTPKGKQSMLAMVQHQANCLRRWANLAATIEAGEPVPTVPSVRGEDADYASFIEAMDNLSRVTAPKLIKEIARKIRYTHVLDVGGASGTWTIAWLTANKKATATLFDLPVVIPMAKARLTKAGMAKRVKLVGGDFTKDPLPAGADLAWVSAIIHQQSREENVALYRKIAAALTPGGTIAIRDIVMSEDRLRPTGGAMFAVNMLSGTATGGTFTLDEMREDLEAAGFEDVRQVREDPWMNSVVAARKRG